MTPEEEKIADEECDMAFQAGIATGRQLALEEAARVVERVRPPIGLHGYNDEAIRHIAAAIRALSPQYTAA